MFAALQSDHVFEDRFGRHGKGNDKGKVEGKVGHARRTVMVPFPRALIIFLIFPAPMRDTTKVVTALFDKSPFNLIQINVALPATPFFRNVLNFDIKNSEREANDFGVFTAD